MTKKESANTPDTCELCGRNDFNRLPYYYTIGKKKFYGARCPGCGLVTVIPKPSADELSRLYDEEYFKGDYHCGHDGQYEEDSSFCAEHDEIIGVFRQYKSSGRFLEVGAAGGKFLNQARKSGYEVFGVEISPDACAIAGRLDIPCFCGELDKAGLADGSFDLAYLGDVLEHVPKPLAALKELNRILAPGGVIGLSCPTNIDLISTRVGLQVYKLLGRERAAPLPPYHLFEFTPKHLRLMLEKAGFTMLGIKVGIIPPWKIQLRGSAFEKVSKAALHWPNYAITTATGYMGDRVRIFAKKG